MDAELNASLDMMFLRQTFVGARKFLTSCPLGIYVSRVESDFKLPFGFMFCGLKEISNRPSSLCFIAQSNNYCNYSTRN